MRRVSLKFTGEMEEVLNELIENSSIYGKVSIQQIVFEALRVHRDNYGEYLKEKIEKLQKVVSKKEKQEVKVEVKKDGPPKPVQGEMEGSLAFKIRMEEWEEENG